MKFDYIHGRALATCFKSHVKVIESAFEALRPGGYLELQDCIIPLRSIDNSLAGTQLGKWTDLMLKSVKAMGLDWTRVSQYKQYMIDAGFEDVVEKSYEWPLGTWAKGERMKMLGLWYREDLLGFLHGASMAVLTRGLKMSTEEVEELLEGVRKDIESNKIHVYVPV